MPKEQPKLKRITRVHEGPMTPVGYFYLCNPSANITLTKDNHDRLNGRIEITDCFPLTMRPQPMDRDPTSFGFQLAAEGLDAAGRDPNDPDTDRWMQGMVVHRLCYMLAMLCGTPEQALLNLGDIFSLPMYGVQEHPPPKAKPRPRKRAKKIRP